jgi:hypothetical protein
MRLLVSLLPFLPLRQSTSLSVALRRLRKHYRVAINSLAHLSEAIFISIILNHTIGWCDIKTPRGNAGCFYKTYEYLLNRNLLCLFLLYFAKADAEHTVF